VQVTQNCWAVYLLCANNIATVWLAPARFGQTLSIHYQTGSRLSLLDPLHIQSSLYLNSITAVSDPTLEAQILQDTVSLDLISKLLVAQDEEFLQSAGSLQPGGKINLDELGDSVWLE